jgi:hypothetical protein
MPEEEINLHSEEKVIKHLLPKRKLLNGEQQQQQQPQAVLGRPSVSSA